MHPSRRRFCLRLASGAVALAAGFHTRRTRAAEAAPGRTPGAFEALDLEGFDARRQRRVPARLYLPSAAKASRPVPLVVFSHGIGGSRLGYSYLGRHWAAHGWASLHPQHVGSDRSLWGGNPFAVLERLHGAATDAEAVDRVLDLRFALDQLLTGALAPRLDAERIVAAGHSYGANTTLLAAGARVRRPGRAPALRDDRLRAALLLSAPPFYGETAFGPILGGVDLPSLHVTATADDIRIPGYFSGLDDRIAVFDAIGGRPKALAVFEGGSHSIFTDRAGTGGLVLNGQVKAATQELTLAFLQRVFEDDGRALQAWPERHAGILARFSVEAA
ncbi:MAG: acetylhydrolase [Betaproteobacteria bacterium]|nr:acetylhydrolase [Betaproteobacteria bacterium]MBK8105353.1 acetylhydrolase [Betaproteobacteria bacterium]